MQVVWCRLVVGLGAVVVLGCAPLAVGPSSRPVASSPTALPHPSPSRSLTARPSPLIRTLGATQSPTVERAASATLRPTMTPTREPSPRPTEATLTLTILYDNYGYDKRLKTAWGFSCLVEWGNRTLLFDTGGDASTLLHNMKSLGANLAEIDTIVISHNHSDHVGGLTGVLAANKETTVYLPSSFSESSIKRIGASARVVEVRQPVPIAEGVYSTGVLGSGIREQALVLRTGQGLVVLTGCAHPGVANLVAKAKEVTGQEVYLVMGGFHLSSASAATIRRTVQELQALGVRHVAPTHCSGDRARALFEEAYDERYIRAGVGKRLDIGP